MDVLKYPVIIDPSWEYANMGIWSALELAICYLGACVPAIKTFVEYILRRSRGTRSRSGNLTSRSRSINTGNNKSSHMQSSTNMSASRSSRQITTKEGHRASMRYAEIELAALQTARRNSAKVWDSEDLNGIGKPIYSTHIQEERDSPGLP